MAGASPAMANSTRGAAENCLGVGQIGPPLDRLDSAVETVVSAAQIGILTFQNTQAALHFTHIIAQPVNGGSDVPQMLKHDIVLAIATSSRF